MSSQKNLKGSTVGSKVSKVTSSPGRRGGFNGPPLNGGIEGDLYLNERLKALEIQRQNIHQIAARLGILDHPQHNGIKVERFTLLTLPNNGRHNGGEGDTFLNSMDPKERVREYHEMVNQKRRQIH